MGIIKKMQINCPHVSARVTGIPRYRKKIASALWTAFIYEGFYADYCGTYWLQHLSLRRIIWVCTVPFLCIFGRGSCIDSSFLITFFYYSLHAKIYSLLYRAWECSEIIEFAYRRIHPRQPFAGCMGNVNIQTRCHLLEYRLPLSSFMRAWELIQWKGRPGLFCIIYRLVTVKHLWKEITDFFVKGLRKNDR